VRFSGIESMKRAYALAIEEVYRFYSYGMRACVSADSMSGLHFELRKTFGAARWAFSTHRAATSPPPPSCRWERSQREGHASESVRSTGADIVLANTYHLMLRRVRSGSRVWAACTGSWAGRTILTIRRVSGHVAAQLRKISEEGVAFRSHIDGAEEFLSPERAMNIQRQLGSDIQMVLDECPAWRRAKRTSSVSGTFVALGPTQQIGIRRTGWPWLFASCKVESFRICGGVRRKS